MTDRLQNLKAWEALTCRLGRKGAPPPRPVTPTVRAGRALAGAAGTGLACARGGASMLPGTTAGGAHGGARVLAGTAGGRGARRARGRAAAARSVPGRSSRRKSCGAERIVRGTGSECDVESVPGSHSPAMDDLGE